MQITSLKEKIPRQRRCPCNNKNRLSKCHAPMIQKVREEQDNKLLKKAISAFSKKSTDFLEEQVKAREERDNKIPKKAIHLFPKKSIDDIKAALKKFPSLKLKSEEGMPVIKGQWNVKHKDNVLEVYDISIKFDANYPISLPKVYEDSNKIKHSSNTHFNFDGSACLFVIDERWECWPVGAPFLRFMEIPVHNFFLYQMHYAHWGNFPEERSHGDKGRVEYYEEKFKCKDPKVIYELLRITLENNISMEQLCPCNKKNQLSNCHGSIVQKLQKNQKSELLRQAMALFSND